MKKIIATCFLVTAMALFEASAVEKSTDKNTVMVMGAVNHPGAVKLEGKLGLVEAIEKAEGFTKRADKKNVKVMSGGLNGSAMFYDVGKILSRVAKNPELRAGDEVLVSETK